MAKTFRIQQALAMALALTLAVPLVAFAADGKKHFKEGMKYEENRQWDKAAQEFALAVREAIKRRVPASPSARSCFRRNNACRTRRQPR